jgi:hypothetical protein
MGSIHSRDQRHAEESREQMADLSRADERVQTIERDDAFRTEVEAAPTVDARRQALDAHGFQDVGLDDMWAYVESKGGKLVIREPAVN